MTNPDIAALRKEVEGIAEGVKFFYDPLHKNGSSYIEMMTPTWTRLLEIIECLTNQPT